MLLFPSSRTLSDLFVATAKPHRQWARGLENGTRQKQGQKLDLQTYKAENYDYVNTNVMIETAILCVKSVLYLGCGVIPKSTLNLNSWTVFLPALQCIWHRNA